MARVRIVCLRNGSSRVTRRREKNNNKYFKLKLKQKNHNSDIECLDRKVEIMRADEERKLEYDKK